MFIKYALSIALFATAMTAPVDRETSSFQPGPLVTINPLILNEKSELLSNIKNGSIDAKEELVTTKSQANDNQTEGLWKKFLSSVFGYQTDKNSKTVTKNENKIKDLEKKYSRKSRTIYLTENDGSYVAVVVPSEAVMSQLQASSKPAQGEVKKTIYLETVPSGGSISSEPIINPVEPVYKGPSAVSRFIGADFWSGPLSESTKFEKQSSEAQV